MGLARPRSQGRREPGCLAYAFAEDINEPGVFHLVERWCDEAAAAAHMLSDALAAFMPQLAALRDVQLRIARYDAPEERVLMGADPAATACRLDRWGPRAQVRGMPDIRSLSRKSAGSSGFSTLDPDACESMADVRAGVDEVDRLLVALIARRQGYMDAAARIKPSRDTVRDEARIREVLAKVKAEAQAQGLSWSIAEPVWREMMERCIAYEFEVWDATRS